MKGVIIADTGAYASLGGPVLHRACTHAAGPYNYQNIDILGMSVYTNNVVAGAFRGFGVTQSCFATENNINLLAEMVGISPWEMRYRNAIRPGQVLPNGQIAAPDTAYAECLEAVKGAYESSPYAGIAGAMKNSGLIILVVAADDGIMPQTVEAINHAKDANVPIIVAINKIDKPDATPDRVRQELTEHGLVVEEWGGDTIAVNVSALQRTGLEELLEMILLVADVKDFKADATVRARGTVVEAELDKGMGSVASVLVSTGTLRVGDSVIAGTAFGKVRAMMNDKGERVEEAGPSTPVRILGLSDVPQAGDPFNAVEDDKFARQVADLRYEKKREEELRQTRRVTLDDLFNQIKEGEVKELKIVIKADVQGSVEAIKQSLENLSTSEVRVNVIHGGVGAVSESDVMLASASNAIIIGFNIRPDVTAKSIADSEGVDIRLYRVIYDAINDVRAAMEGLLEPEVKEVILGRAEVRATFKVPKVGIIAGSYVTSGKVSRNAQVRVLRDNVVVHEGKVESLKRLKDDAKEVLEGYECGIGIERFNDVKEGDVLEAFVMEKVARHLE
jgi:translation initiation factor IF-2